MRTTAPLLLLALTLAACSDGKDTTSDETDVEVEDTGDTGTPTTDTDPGETDGTPTDDSDTPVDTETDTDAAPTGPETCTSPPAVGLAHVCNLSVNNAAVVKPTTAGQPLVLDVRRSTTAPAVGAFNGNGRGNRAIAGLHGYSQLDLDDLDSITWDAEEVASAVNIKPDLALQVDLDCTNSDFVLLEARWTSLGTPVDLGQDRARWTASLDADVWHALGGVADPADPFADPILYDPGDLDGEPLSLSAFRAAYPDACLRNRNAGFADLPKGFISSGVLLTLGTSVSYLQRTQWKIWRITVGDDVLSPP